MTSDQYAPSASVMTTISSKNSGMISSEDRG
jgi:hypothetical protein